jgi:hypothetical protein
MSDNSPLFETAIIISPNEHLKPGEYHQLPLHINAVDPFIASESQTKKLAEKIAFTLRRNTFNISGFEQSERGVERIQRLGGMVLHDVHDEIIDVMNRLKVVHDNEKWVEGVGSFYTGTWFVPDRVKVTHVHLAQELPESQKWQILETYELEPLPYADFRNDPLYIDSVINPITRRKAS